MVANPVFTILREANHNALVYFTGGEDGNGMHRVFLRSEVDEACQRIAQLPLGHIPRSPPNAIDHEHSESIVTGSSTENYEIARDNLEPIHDATDSLDDDNDSVDTDTEKMELKMSGI
jgi:hypothetical protein